MIEIIIIIITTTTTATTTTINKHMGGCETQSVC